MLHIHTVPTCQVKSNRMQNFPRNGKTNTLLCQFCHSLLHWSTLFVAVQPYDRRLNHIVTTAVHWINRTFGTFSIWVALLLCEIITQFMQHRNSTLTMNLEIWCMEANAIRWFTILLQRRVCWTRIAILQQFLAVALNKPTKTWKMNPWMPDQQPGRLTLHAVRLVTRNQSQRNHHSTKRVTQWHQNVRCLDGMVKKNQWSRKFGGYRPKPSPKPPWRPPSREIAAACRPQ